MKRYLMKIISLLIILGAVLFSAPVFADGCKPTKCPKTCSAASATNCDQKFDAGCIVNKNQNNEDKACFNNVPIGAADYASSQCASSSENGESGTNFPVTAQAGEQVTVKAAAKGKVIFAGITEDGGRTVIIEHTKGCEDEGHGDTGKYHTIYRHLLSFSVSQGAEVELGTPIGVVGGSTGTENGSVCDNKEQAGLSGYSTSGCTTTKADDIHLNFEVVDGPASASSSSASASASLNSNCPDIQNMCGSCSSDIDACIFENPASYRDSTAVTTNIDHKDLAAKSETKAACETGLKIDPEGCVFCGLFKDIFNAASAIAKTANDGLAIPTRNIVGIGFFIWLAIFVLRNIASMGQIKMGDMLKSMIFQGFRVAIIMVILGGAIYQVMDLTINPILQTGLSFTRTLSTTSTCPADAEYLQNLVGYDANKGFQKNSSGGLSIQVGTAFVCSIKKLEDNVSRLMSYGHYSSCLSFKDFKTLGIVPHAGFLTTGAFLYIVGAILMIMFPWFLIDCLLQLCISVALLPCAIGAFAFKITSQYLKTLWDYFMNSMFTFVFIAIIIFIITANFKTWLGYDFNDENIDPNIFINATNNGLAWWGTSAFRILGICFFCFVFLDEAKSMAEKFAKAPVLGGGQGIGQMFGGLAASAGFNATKSGAEVLGNAGSALKETTGESIESFMGAQTRSMSNHAMGIMSRITGAEKITDDKGNVVGYNRKMKFFGRNYESKYTQDENGIWTSSITRGDKTTIDDAIMKTTLTKNKDGEVVGIDTKARNVSSKYMVNADKTINQNSVDQLMKNAENKEFAARHIVSTVMKDRGMQLDDKFLSSKTTINEDGSFTIEQKNEDGKMQTVNARIEDGKMIIQSDIADGEGNVKSTISDGLSAPKEQQNESTSGSTAKTGKRSFIYDPPAGTRPQTGKRSFIYDPPESARPKSNKKSYL